MVMSEAAPKESKAVKRPAPDAHTKLDPIYGFLAGGGEMGRLMRTYDWTATAVGPPDQWPQSLRTAVSIILNSALPMFIWWGKDDLLNFYNDAYIEVLGQKHPAALGTSGKAVWTEIWSDIGPLADQVYEKATPVYLKDLPLKVSRHGYDEQTYFTFSYSPIRDETGGIGGLYCACVETTHEVETGRALQVERDKLRSLFMQAPAMIAVLRGPNHVFELANPGYMQLVGQRTLVGKPIRDALPEVAGQGIYEILDEVYQTGKPYSAHQMPVILNRDGEGDMREGYFNFVYQPSYDVHAQVDGILVHAVEVTQQVLAIKRIEALATLNRSITDNASTALVIMDSRLHCTFMNPAAEMITGYSFEEITQLGTPLHDILHCRNASGHSADITHWNVNGAKTAKEQQKGEDEYVKKDGSAYPVYYVVSRLESDDASTMCILEFRDITEEKAAMKRQQQLVSITNQRNELIKLNKTKDEFIGMASHQLRTPATVVKQYISLLREGFGGGLSESQRSFIEKAYVSNERQLGIINDLLKTAQLDADRYVLNKQTVTLGELVARAVADTDELIKSRSQTVVLRHANNQKTLSVDATEMNLVLVNLIENASKYSPHGCAVTINVTELPDAATIEVRDKGVGIKKADQERIFDKFTRVDNELSDTVSGSGLGLYLVERIVKMHGGTITVTSAFKHGSSFIVRLPYEQ